MKFVSNFKDLEKELNKRIEKVNGSVSFGQLFTESFMTKYTQFSSIDELFESGGFKVDNEEDFDAIPDAELDEHVRKTTNFESWEDMLNEAGAEYVARELKL